MSVLLQFSMFPVGKEESLSRYVARSLDIIDKSGLEYKVGPMGTVIEGEWGEVMQVVQQCYELMRHDCDRIYCGITVDYRNGREGGLAGKVSSVEEKLGRKLRR